MHKTGENKSKNYSHLKLEMSKYCFPHRTSSVVGNKLQNLAGF